VLAVIPIGGGDMPVVSLLNSFTGLATARPASRFQRGLDHQHTLVGASRRSDLSHVQAMNRPITNVLFGAFGATPKAHAPAAGERRGGRPPGRGVSAERRDDPGLRAR
jgi:NAD(P) transhydrogenase subunit beta